MITGSWLNQQGAANILLILNHLLDDTPFESKAGFVIRATASSCFRLLPTDAIFFEALNGVFYINEEPTEESKAAVLKAYARVSEYVAKGNTFL